MASTVKSLLLEWTRNAFFFSFESHGSGIAFILFWTIYACMFYCRHLHPLRRVPGPILACSTWCWSTAHARWGDMDYAQRELHKKYGPLVRIVPGQVLCSDPSAIKIIYGSDSGWRGRISHFKKSNFYDVLRTPNAKQYQGYPGHCVERSQLQKHIVDAAFMSPMIAGLEGSIDSQTQTLTNTMNDLARRKNPVDLRLLFKRNVFIILGKCLWGPRFGAITQLGDLAFYLRAMENQLPNLATFAIQPPWLRAVSFRLLQWLSPPSRLTNLAMFATEGLSIDLRRIIARRYPGFIPRFNEDPDISQIMVFFAAAQVDDDGVGPKEVHTELMAALFGGTDPTSITLTMTLYYLMRHPAAYQKLVAEIDTAYTDGKASTPISYSQANALPYLRACITEAMRLHPAVGFHLPRVVPPGGVTVCGVFIPEGYHIGMNPAVVQYNEEVFGEDPDKFNPERWLTGDVNQMEKVMMVFGHGSSGCTGKNLALSVVYKLIPHILRHFDVRLCRGEDLKKENWWFNLASNVSVEFSKRDLDNK